MVINESALPAWKAKLDEILKLLPTLIEGSRITGAPILLLELPEEVHPGWCEQAWWWVSSYGLEEAKLSRRHLNAAGHDACLTAVTTAAAYLQQPLEFVKVNGVWWLAISSARREAKDVLPPY